MKKLLLAVCTLALFTNTAFAGGTPGSLWKPEDQQKYLEFVQQAPVGDVRAAIFGYGLATLGCYPGGAVYTSTMLAIDAFIALIDTVAAPAQFMAGQKMYGNTRDVIHETEKMTKSIFGTKEIRVGSCPQYAIMHAMASAAYDVRAERGEPGFNLPADSDLRGAAY